MNASKAKQERRQYSAEFKSHAVQRAMNRGDSSVSALAKEIGVSQSVLQHWVNRHLDALKAEAPEPRGPGRPSARATNGGSPGTQIAMVLPVQESANSATLRDRCRDLENENARLKRALQALLGTDPITGH